MELEALKKMTKTEKSTRDYATSMANALLYKPWQAHPAGCRTG
ncbi:hypothetical protein ACJJIK_07730 [Microbulbifer sp. ZKSA006]